MFRDQLTGLISKPGEKQHRMVIETRARQYNNNGVISQGHEIVREIVHVKQNIVHVKRNIDKIAEHLASISDSDHEE